MDQCLGTTNARTEEGLAGGPGEIEKMVSLVLNMPWDTQVKIFCGQLVLMVWSLGKRDRFRSHQDLDAT